MYPSLYVKKQAREAAQKKGLTPCQSVALHRYRRGRTAEEAITSSVNWGIKKYRKEQSQ